VIKKLQERLQ
jgi:hypothetical protein